MTVKKRAPPRAVIGVLGEEAAVDLTRSGVTDYVLKDRLARLGSAVLRALASTGRRW